MSVLFMAKVLQVDTMHSPAEGCTERWKAADTPLRDAIDFPWILPRPKNMPPACFLHGLSNPIIHKNNRHPKGTGCFYGVDNGIRTHDLQSHNLTR